jgi:hypothetical protein
MIYYYFYGSALDNHFYHPIFSLFPYTHTHTHTSPHKLHVIEFSLTLHLDWIFKFLNKKTYDKKLGKSTTWTSHPLPSSIRLVKVVEWSLIIWSQYSEMHKNLKRLIEQCQPRNLHKKVQSQQCVRTTYYVSLSTQQASLLFLAAHESGGEPPAKTGSQKWPTSPFICVK